MRSLLVLAALVVFPLPASAANPSAAGVKLEIDRRGGVFVDVEINQGGPYRFVVDTGSSRSLVSDSLARELDAPVVARSEVVTSSGSEMRLVVRLGSLAITAMRSQQLLAPVLPDAQLAPLGPGVRGVLGQDFLSAFNYTLDYRRARLTWDEAVACSAAGAVRMTQAEGRFVMMVGDGSGGTLRLVPDSGAEVAVLFRRDDPRDATSPLGAIRVGGVTLKNLVAYNVRRTDPEADGLLPLHHFSQVSFAAGGTCLVVTR